MFDNDAMSVNVTLGRHCRCMFLMAVSLCSLMAIKDFSVLCLLVHSSLSINNCGLFVAVSQ